MKILPCVRLPIKTTAKTALFFAAICSFNSVCGQNLVSKDTINHSIWNPYTNVEEKETIQFPYLPPELMKKDTISETCSEITPIGVEVCENIEFPDNDIVIAGKTVKASIVIDLSKNVLYSYDTNGTPSKAYLIASGKKSTPTKKGVRQISHFEYYPYKTAPASTKRRKHPKDYGPAIIILNIIDTATGNVKYSNGQFIHGNRNPESLGKYSSKGCIRMDNTAILEMVDESNIGDYVLIK